MKFSVTKIRRVESYKYKTHCRYERFTVSPVILTTLAIRVLAEGKC